MLPSVVNCEEIQKDEIAAIIADNNNRFDSIRPSQAEKAWGIYNKMPLDEKRAPLANGTKYTLFLFSYTKKGAREMAIFGFDDKGKLLNSASLSPEDRKWIEDNVSSFVAKHPVLK